MGKVERTSLQDTINGLKFYGRYVDDIFCLTDATTDTDALVQKFNTAHPSVKFSAELEADNEIAFLDVLLRRQEDGSIQRRLESSEDRVNCSSVFSEAILVLRKWSLIYVDVKTAGKKTNEDLPGDVEKRDTSEIITESPVPLALAEDDNRRFLEILTDLSSASHLLVEGCEAIHQSVTTVLVDFCCGRIGASCFPAGQLVHGPHYF
ncbi:hypothetical protein SprV_0100313200 [Sparganum proliferum]